jgi:hypothetical protein
MVCGSVAYLAVPFTPSEFDKTCRPAFIDAWWKPPFDWSYFGNPLAEHLREARAGGLELWHRHQ